VFLIAVLARKNVDFVAIMVSAVLADIEPILVLLGVIDGPLRGFLHSFEGGVIIAFTTTILVYLLNDYRETFLQFIGFEQVFSLPKTFLGSTIGAFSHVVLDSAIYGRFNILYVLEWPNIFYGYISTVQMYVLCIITSLVGILLFHKWSSRGLFNIRDDLNEKIV